MFEAAVNQLRGIKPEALLELLGLSQPPFDPFDIAKRIGIELLDDVDFTKLHMAGSICVKNGRPEIWVNPVDSVTRQNFTVAHELGHYVNDLLGKKNAEGFEDNSETLFRNGASNAVEIAANRFAAELLMPKPAVTRISREIINEYKQEQNSPTMPAVIFVEKMTERFNVSKQSMVIRLENLGILKSKKK